MPYSEPAFDSSPIDVHDAKELMQHVYFQFIVYYYEERREKTTRTTTIKSNVQLKCVQTQYQ